MTSLTSMGLATANDWSSMSALPPTNAVGAMDMASLLSTRRPCLNASTYFPSAGACNKKWPGKLIGTHSSPHRLATHR